MPKYIIETQVTLSRIYIVDADSEDEAISKRLKLCDQEEKEVLFLEKFLGERTKLISDPVSSKMSINKLEKEYNEDLSKPEWILKTRKRKDS